MSPLLRLWGITAICIGALLMLRGAFALALSCFLFLPLQFFSSPTAPRST